MRAIQRCAEIGKEVLGSSATELIQKVNGSPMLSSKSADGTPISVMHRTEHVLPSGEKVARAGKKTCEFLVKNQFLRAAVPGGTVETRVLIQDPIPLDHGKSASAIFESCVKDWRSLRQMGHAGCAIEHYCFDRFAISAHERLWRQWHAMVAGRFDPMAVGMDVQIFRLTEFVVVTPCALHDASNALRWALAWKFDDKELLRDAYIGVESLRNSWNLLSSNVASWATQRLHIVDNLADSEVQLRAAMWTALDVEPETVEILSATLQLSFTAERLCVCASAQAEPDLIGLVVSALMSTWRFTKWSGGRFVSVGVSSRAIVAALLTGMEDFVAFIEADSNNSMFYLNGFTRLTGTRKTFLVECAIASRVTEGVLHELTEDPRVCKMYDSLWQTLATEMKWVISLPDGLWHALAVVTEQSANDLKSSCIAAAHTSFHFFWRRVLQPAAQRPWTLARGDMRENLRALRVEEEMPDEPVSGQMWLLMQMGFPSEQLVRTLQLLGEISWSSMVAEQQHGSLATLKRYHPECQTETLVGRAQVMMLWRLLPKPSQEERTLFQIEQQLARLARKIPQRPAADRCSWRSFSTTFAIAPGMIGKSRRLSI